MKIDDPNQVNYFINLLAALQMGSETPPIISNASPTVATVPKDSFIYAIKADGAANLVISAIIDPNGNAYTLTGGDITILAGDVFYIPCSLFTLSSGKYIAYLRSRKL